MFDSMTSPQVKVVEASRAHGTYMRDLLAKPWRVFLTAIVQELLACVRPGGGGWQTAEMPSSVTNGSSTNVRLRRHTDVSCKLQSEPMLQYGPSLQCGAAVCEILLHSSDTSTSQRSLCYSALMQELSIVTHAIQLLNVSMPHRQATVPVLWKRVLRVWRGCIRVLNLGCTV